MWPLVLYLGLPVLLAVAFWRTEKAALARKRALLLRAPSEGAPGVELKVRVDAASGQRLSLGSSAETPESVSATPTLTTAEVVLVEETFAETDGPAPAHIRPGRRLVIKPGEPMTIAGLPGARRKPLDIETTDTGVVHHYSFELASEKVFWISGVLEAPDASGPFRGGDTWQLAPLPGSPGPRAYLVSATRGARARKNEDASLGLGGSLFFAGVAIGVSFVPYAGVVLWFLVVALMLVLTLNELGEGRPKAQNVAAPEGSVPPKVRVAVPAEETTPDDLAEEADGEEEPPPKSSRA